MCFKVIFLCAVIHVEPKTIFSDDNKMIDGLIVYISRMD